ncbi:MAG: hypothetical protein JXR94_09745 [Candidatus Hydrogenedentes bacterium]|nr:hypothetical protein [Candidatus Hydrogenedentota bacterium]
MWRVIVAAGFAAAASAFVHNAQQKGRALSAVSLVTDQGDFHPSLDKPKDGVFEASDFRVRYELVADGGTVNALEEGRFELAAGPCRAVIHTRPARFGEHTVAWEVQQGPNSVFVDGVCYRCEKRAFDLADIGEVELVFGLELLEDDAAVSQEPIAVTRNDEEGTLDARWGENLSLRVPLRAHKRP